MSRVIVSVKTITIQYSFARIHRAIALRPSSPPLSIPFDPYSSSSPTFHSLPDVGLQVYRMGSQQTFEIAWERLLDDYPETIPCLCEPYGRAVRVIAVVIGM